MNTTITLHIYARAAKANAAGLHPLYVRITIDGKRTEFSSKKFINPKHWDQKMMKMKGNTEEARSINSYLEKLKAKITQTQIVLEYQEIALTLESFMHVFIGKSAERERTLIPVFEEHNKRLFSLVGIEYAQGTYERYQTSLQHTKEFIQYQYGVNDIALSKIDHRFITDYDFYLRTKRACGNNTTVRYIKNFKKIILICIANGWIQKDPFLNYKTKIQEVERDILSQEELQRLMAKEINVERLAVVRDIFVFSCFTGLAYIDVKQLTPANLTKGIDGQMWISTHRQKTDTLSKIPLLDTARLIIEKYRNHPKSGNEGTLLPILTNQKMNAYLKEVAAICHINKELTFHCARHTFATTVTLSNGVPIESVSKMLGHKSIKTTQHYAKITDRKVANDMENLKKILNHTGKLPNTDKKSG
ncbi:site-specific integrase [Olivibacter sp. XZL3]|uniref:site-specific integrase n=1 Tax=Olivibacter sp. XZL3 TaxID=1735116 RepID=UPI001066AA21|nr:site-specific integrase [Olivibacter sp. XZL3]